MAGIASSSPYEKALYGKNAQIHTSVSEIPPSHLSNPPPTNEQDESRKSSSVTLDLLLPCAIIIVPTLVLSALLLYFVFEYQVKPPTFANLDLRVPFSESSTAHYYVNFSTSKISTIVGKFTTAAGLATSTALALLAIPIARRISAHSQHGTHEHLPKPYQLTLLIGVFNNGGPSAVLKYLR